jgi:hypothetical protein
VVGFDLLPGEPERPARYRVVRGNLLQGLPFRDGRFDYVHQRLLVSGIPRQAWPAVVGELVRVAAAGGWIELVEGPLRVNGGGPATDRLGRIMGQLSASLGLDAEGAVFESLDGYLRSAGVEEVTRHDLSIPIGRWAGSLAATDFRAGATRVCEVLKARSMLSAEDAHALIHGAQEEMDDHRTSWSSAVAIGRKPA